MRLAETFLLFSPAFLANATPVVVRVLPLLRQWNTPIFPRLFGHHKTFRGLFSGVIVAILTAYVLHRLNLGSALYASLPRALLAGALLGAGALGGDLVKSFCKRRAGIRPGHPWIVWDGIDYILGAMLLLSPIYTPTFWEATMLIIIAPLLSLSSNILAYFCGLKESWH